MYVAEADGRGVVGFISGGPERTGDPAYAGEVYAVYILGQYQRQGIGRQLVVTLVNQLLREGMTGAGPARLCSPSS